MEFDRFTAKTLDEAIEAALAAKQCAREELVYTVVEEKAGFLGLGRTTVIEAWGPGDVADFIHDYIQTYFDNAHMDGVCQVERDDQGFYRVQVDTRCNAVLIGKQGRSLQDFTRLVREAASTAFKQRVRLMMDVNGYKEERYKKVVKMAVRVAKDVRRTKVSATLDPMPADERKAVHDALSDMASISTKSEGEGLDRRLHILYTPQKEGQ